MALVAQQTGLANNAGPALFGKTEGLRTVHVRKSLVAKKVAAGKAAVARRARCTLAPRCTFETVLCVRLVSTSSMDLNSSESVVANLFAALRRLQSLIRRSPTMFNATDSSAFLMT